MVQYHLSESRGQALFCLVDKVGHLAQIPFERDSDRNEFFDVDEQLCSSVR